MKLRLKKLSDQVIVITGASSGIGLSTARMAAKKGAKLVLVARSGSDLQQLGDEIRRGGGQALAVEADVADESSVREAAEAAIKRFGGFDTWVNNAGASVYGRSMEVSIEDMKRVIDTNLWGVIYGSRIAVEHLRKRGGALINVGSEVSDIAGALQGIYSASKHAVKAWTEVLRIELEDEGAPISITLVKPGAIDTPFPDHAKNYLPDQPKHTPPVYAPEAVAEAILHAATTPVRDLFVGASAKAASSLRKVAPSLSDVLVRKTLIPGTHSGEPRRNGEGLHHAGGGLQERGHYPGLVQTKSVYTKASMHPVLTGMAAVGAGLALAAAFRGRGE
jgi:short-subunit dehydrogenase